MRATQLRLGKSQLSVREYPSRNTHLEANLHVELAIFCVKSFCQVTRRELIVTSWLLDGIPGVESENAHGRIHANSANRLQWTVVSAN